MATFKELVEGALYDSDTGGRQTIPPSIPPAETTGQQATATRYVREAWKRLQQDDEQWLWMRMSFDGTLVAGQAEYAHSDLVSVDPPFATDPAAGASDPPVPRQPRTWLTQNNSESVWYITDPVNGLIRGGILPEIPWQQYRARRNRRSTPETGRPNLFTVTPRRKILFLPTPDEAYEIDGEYQRGVQIFGNTAADWDVEPEDLPEEFHEMIKWAAIMMINGFDEANESYAFAQNEYTKDHNNMKRLNLEGYTIAPAIGSGSVRTSSFGGDFFDRR